jgi:hypothetical protein
MSWDRTVNLWRGPTCISLFLRPETDENVVVISGDECDFGFSSCETPMMTWKVGSGRSYTQSRPLLRSVLRFTRHTH